MTQVSISTLKIIQEIYDENKQNQPDLNFHSDTVHNKISKVTSIEGN